MNSNSDSGLELKFARARSNFPGALSTTYVDVASQGLISRQTFDAANLMARQQMDGLQAKEAGLRLVENARARFAALIGAGAQEVALTRNVSDGLNAIVAALPWRAGDNLIYCPALEHQNGISTIMNLRHRGVELRAVAAPQGVMEADAVEGLIDSHTRLVFLSSVSFLPGFRNGLAAIGAVCRPRGIFFLVDAVQSLGILGLNVAQSHVDGLATSTSKGLLGLTGMGFLYCQSEWSQKLNPAYLSGQGVSTDLTGDAEIEGTLAPKAGAARFHLGTPNWPALAAAEAGLRSIAEIGQAEIERHCLSLAQALRAGLASKGLSVFTPAREEWRSHIVAVGRRQPVPDGEIPDPALRAMAERLVANNIRFSVRRGTLRFAFHLYNDNSDVTRLLELCR